MIQALITINHGFRKAKGKAKRNADGTFSCAKRELKITTHISDDLAALGVGGPGNEDVLHMGLHVGLVDQLVGEEVDVRAPERRGDASVAFLEKGYL